MEKYQTKATKVNVTKWEKHGDHHLINKKRQTRANKDTPCYVCGKPMSDHGWFWWGSSYYDVCPNSFIVEGDDNFEDHINVCDKDTFEDLYEKIETEES